MAASSSAGTVLSLLSSENADVRFAALECLDAFNDPKNGAAIIPLTKDPSIRISTLARTVASRWGIDFSEYVSKAEASLSSMSA